MSSDRHLAPFAGPAFSQWRHLTAREKAKACALVLLAGWRGRVDIERGTSYDTDDDVVAVAFVPGDIRSGHVIGTVAQEADVTLAAIELAYGADARRWAETTIQQEG